MTKSYQQKMREWQTMQKSNFLVSYRRQSIINKIDMNTEIQKPFIVPTVNEASIEPKLALADTLDTKNQGNFVSLSPILSPNQRSLILYQWREIMFEEVFLLNYNEYLQKKMQQIKQLETDLKSLKTSIFCTTDVEYYLKHHSMTSIGHDSQGSLNQHKQKQKYLSQRRQSLQSLTSMPASWILAVQSAAYSDVLDGTSEKTTEWAIIFNKKFFDLLKHYKEDRQNFEDDTIRDLRRMSSLK